MTEMPEDERVPPTAADLEDDYPWDGERDLPEWTDSDDGVVSA